MFFILCLTKLFPYCKSAFLFGLFLDVSDTRQTKLTQEGLHVAVHFYGKTGITKAQT